ncbi:MAG: hypothetical protein Q7K57_27180 [Burkholderiaceae bacterium]|nr:hypothetical protein [Burkholderiaceae bacterium]
MNNAIPQKLSQIDRCERIALTDELNNFQQIQLSVWMSNNRQHHAAFFVSLSKSASIRAIT